MILGFMLMLGIASASMGQTLKKNAIYLSRLGWLHV